MSTKTVIGTYEDRYEAYEVMFSCAKEIKERGLVGDLMVQVQKRAGLYYVILIDRR